jgi:hypothetical protein
MIRTTEKELLDMLLKLLSTLATDAETTELIIEQGGARHVMDLMRAWPHDYDILSIALDCVTKMTGTLELCAKCEKSYGLLGALSEMLLPLRDNCDCFTLAVQVLINLAAAEQNAAAICGRLLAVVFSGVRAHIANQAFMRTGASLLAVLTLYPAAAALVLEAGGIALVLDCLRANREYPALLAKLVRVLPNFCVGDAGSAAASVQHQEVRGAQLLEDAQARQLVDELHRQHPQNAQLSKAQEALNKRIAEITAAQQRAPTEEKKELSIRDRLDEGTRNMLLAGSIFSQHRDGQAVRPRLVRFTDRVDALILEDPERKKDPLRIPVQDIKEAMPGACTSALQHKVFGSKQAVPEASFAIYFKRLDNKPLSIEADTNEKSLKWINGINKLLDLSSSMWKQ